VFGGPRRTGELLVQPDLAATLRELAAEPTALYHGRLAEAIAGAVREEGGWLTPDDLAAHSADWTQPLRAPFSDWVVEEMPPNSQGVAALIGLTLLGEGGPPPREDEAAWTRRSVDAARILMAVREAEITDPAFMTRAAEDLLGEGYLAPLRALVREGGPVSTPALEAVVGRAVPAVEGVHQGDTVHFAIVDADGLAVSCIQSVFDSFGSGIVVPGTGILLHNRGSSFKLDPGHPNALAPGKRPMHTLAPGMATGGGRTAAVFGCMGGHAQAQIHLQVIGALAGQGLDPAAAVERPRWTVPPVTDPEADVVDVEDRGVTAQALADGGYQVRRVEPFAQRMGHAQVILVDHAAGALMGAADPRSDGVALGY
jgi:gamma-glutamyltranspeptidase/glutathione hydrolase